MYRVKDTKLCEWIRLSQKLTGGWFGVYKPQVILLFLNLGNIPPDSIM